MPSPALDPVPAPTAPALRRSTLLALCACVLVAQSMVAAINLLIPQLSSSSLHPSSSELLWTVDAYVIVFASSSSRRARSVTATVTRALCSPAWACSPRVPPPAPSPRTRRCSSPGGASPGPGPR